MYCFQSMLLLVLLPTSTASPALMALFLVALFLNHRPCAYCSFLFCAVLWSSCWWAPTCNSLLPATSNDTAPSTAECQQGYSTNCWAPVWDGWRVRVGSPPAIGPPPNPPPSDPLDAAVQAAWAVVGPAVDRKQLDRWRAVWAAPAHDRVLLKLPADFGERIRGMHGGPVSP
ncbi:hypothetical protein BC828DRAFT_382491 [Blastocladiella britannica]|nr:hypothetical protein BC828DRAFT_382491 [Blastocladiella britannica]